MPDAAVVSVSKAAEKQIRTAMDAGDLAAKGQLVRSYADWEFESEKQDDLALREEDKLRIDVVAHMTEQTADLSTRSGKVAIVVPVDIAVRKKFGSDSLCDDTGEIKIELIDNLVLLVQQLYLMFMPIRLVDFPHAVWDGENGGVKILVAPDRRHLRDMRQFTGLIRVYFKATTN